MRTDFGTLPIPKIKGNFASFIFFFAQLFQVCILKEAVAIITAAAAHTFVEEISVKYAKGEVDSLNRGMVEKT